MSFEVIDGKKGLGNHIVYCLLQDSRGFIWAGTDYGLYRYDGISCTGFFAGRTQNSGLTNSHVNRLAQDAEGNIWVGTSRGLSRMNPETGEMVHYLNTEQDEKANKGISYQVFADKNGGIWAANGYFLFRFEREKGDFTRFPVDCGQSAGNTRNYFILDLLDDARGNFWLATSYGIKKFSTRSGSLKSYHFPENETRLVENAVTSLEQAPDGSILAGTWGGGMLRYDARSDRVEKISFQGNSHSSGIVLDIRFSGDKLYVGTGNGLLEAMAEKGPSGMVLRETRLYLKDRASERSISDNAVNCLLMDRAKNLWIGTNNSISRADFRLSFFQFSEIKAEGRIRLIPNAVVEDPVKPSTGNLWIAAEGLYLAKPGQGIVKDLKIDKYILNDEGQKTVWDINRGKSCLWLATAGGLFQFDPQNQRVLKTWYHEHNNPESLPGQKIFRVYEDRNGRVWVSSTRRGVGVLNTATGRFKNYFGKPDDPFTLFNHTPSTFFEDRAGNIWFSRVGLLYQYVHRADSFRVIKFSVAEKAGVSYSGNPYPFMEDKNGAIWLTCTEGIISFNPQTGIFTPVQTGIPFFKPSGAIAKDSLGHFWLGTSNGIFRWDSLSNTISRFTTNDGLVNNETDGCITTLSNGIMVIGSAGYISWFSPKNLLRKALPPPVSLSGVQVNGRDTFTRFLKPPSFPHQSTLTFSFAALSFGNATQNQYSYMLKGADKNWNAPVKNNTVTYAKLPAGTYIFLVKGCNSDGVWNTNPVSFAFKVEAPFYLQGWFIALSVALTVMGIFLLYRYRLNQALRIERLRTRLATDLHDDVGATLSAISMYSEALKKQVDHPQVVKLLGKIGDDSRETVRAMGDLVWAINPKNDSAKKLQHRMANYAIDLCAAKEVKLSLELDERLNNQTVGVETRRNIYLIFKEAMNNALKYSGCSIISISTFAEGTQFTMVITDNGSGFEVKDHSPGNGLANMHLRASEIGGKLNIISHPDNGGCRVELTCQLK